MTIDTTLTILDIVQTLALLSFLINSSHYSVNIHRCLNSQSGAFKNSSICLEYSVSEDLNL